MIRATFKRQLLKLCCYLLTAAISLSPVVHASYMSLHGVESRGESRVESTVESGQISQNTHSAHSHGETSDASIHCHHQEFDVTGAMESCDHDSVLNCKIFCTASIGTIPISPMVQISDNEANKWLTHHSTHRLQSIPLSVFKPPRI